MKLSREPCGIEIRRRYHTGRAFSAFSSLRASSLPCHADLFRNQADQSDTRRILEQGRNVPEYRYQSKQLVLPGCL